MNEIERRNRLVCCKMRKIKRRYDIYPTRHRLHPMASKDETTMSTITGVFEKKIGEDSAGETKHLIELLDFGMEHWPLPL